MKYRLGIIIGLLMAFLSLYPQFYFQIKRGENFQGATFYYDFDESAYAAYLQSLIDGNPRKNDFYNNSNQSQSDENLFSIQFASSYPIAIPARLLGLSSDTAFLYISFIFAFLTSLSIFWLLLKITNNPYLAAVGTLFILLFGANVSGASILKETFGFGASAFYLTFLRRYTPAVAFPVLFLLIGFVWLGIKTDKSKEKYLFAVLSSVCFAFLVYAYFFFWTAILAWLIGFALLYLLTQPNNRNWKFWLIIFGGAICALIPYFLLLLSRHSTTDSSYILEHTRKIVFLRPTLIVGVFILFLMAISIKLKRLEWQNPLTILITSLAILPILVFNQQIITGLSLQPLHYNIYILNYLILLALVLLIGEVFKERLAKISPLIWISLVLIFCVWGIIETDYTTKYRLGYNFRRDEAYPANRRLAELSRENFAEAQKQVTLNFDPVQGDNQPTVAPQSVLWSEHLFFGGNISAEEHQRRYFLYLYFQNRDVSWLRKRLQSCPNEVCRALVGWRINPTLSFYSSKVELTEVTSLVEKYSNFINNLTASDALNPTITYLIVPKDWQFDYSNFEKWYQKEKSEQIRNFILYKVKAK